MRPHGAGWGRPGPELGAARAELTANVRGGRICVTPCRRGLGWPHASVVRGRGSRFIVPPPHFTQEEAEGCPGKGNVRATSVSHVLGS